MASKTGGAEWNWEITWRESSNFGFLRHGIYEQAMCLTETGVMRVMWPLGKEWFLLTFHHFLGRYAPSLHMEFWVICEAENDRVITVLECFQWDVRHTMMLCGRSTRLACSRWTNCMMKLCTAMHCRNVCPETRCASQATKIWLQDDWRMTCTWNKIAFFNSISVLDIFNF